MHTTFVDLFIYYASIVSKANKFNHIDGVDEKGEINFIWSNRNHYFCAMASKWALCTTRYWNICASTRQMHSIRPLQKHRTPLHHSCWITCNGVSQNLQILSCSCKAQFTRLYIILWVYVKDIRLCDKVVKGDVYNRLGAPRRLS